MEVFGFVVTFVVLFILSILLARMVVLMVAVIMLFSAFALPGWFVGALLLVALLGMYAQDSIVTNGHRCPTCGHGLHSVGADADGG